MRGFVEEILIATVAGAAMISVNTAHAVPGRGLAGDRYFSNIGTWSTYRDQSGKELTLVEAEVLEDVGLTTLGARRNIITRGIRLNQLVGRRFRIGQITCTGVRLCEPCTYLQEHTGIDLHSLTHRGGLRADILTVGEITIGDPIELDPNKPPIGTITPAIDPLRLG